MQFSDRMIKSILLKGDYITSADIKKAEVSIKKDKINFVDYLFSKKLVNKTVLGQALGEHFNVPFLDLSQHRIDEQVFNLIPEIVARSKGVVAVSKTLDGVRVGMIKPDDLDTRNLIEKRIGQPILPYIIFDKDLDEVFGRYQGSVKDSFELLIEKLKNEDLEREDRDEVIVKMVDSLLFYGYQNKASDIHIEPYRKKIIIRFRIDGVLHDILSLSKELLEFFIARIKIMSKMRTDLHSAAQDGKLRYNIKDDVVDVRVSIVPVTEGENIVMRILSAKARQFDLVGLGFGNDDFKKVKKAIKSAYGMIIITGPTGSGKTTTLYAIMKILNKRDVHVSTIEDPVEYSIEGISQIQVNTRTDLTFAKGLRAIVRQDPDIIMVGEIRDGETASIAVNSAMTGHLVLSTIHANNSATTLPRLLNMGIEPFLVASTLNIVVAQRLVRKICTTCKRSSALTAKEVEAVDLEPEIKAYFEKKGYPDFQKIRYYRGEGCKFCDNTGYTGRVGIFEILELKENIKKLILLRSSSGEIMEVARNKNDMKTLLEDGLDKVLIGVTTLDEILRVTKIGESVQVPSEDKEDILELETLPKKRKRKIKSKKIDNPIRTP